MTKALLLCVLQPRASAEESAADTLHLNAAFALAFSGFMRMGELTHSAVEEASPDFERTKLTTRCLTIAATGDHLQLFLPRSKGDRTNRGITITMAATGDLACPVQNATALLRWRANARPSEPLFTLERGGFDREYVLAALRRRLLRLGEHAEGITGHSFRRGAAQHADECGLSKEEIQVLGRWAGDSVERYYTQGAHRLLALQKRLTSNNKTNNAIGAVSLGPHTHARPVDGSRNAPKRARDR